MTGNTPPRGVTGDVVFLEDANPAFLDSRITGSIVVTFNTFSGSFYEHFFAYKPAGLVSIQSVVLCLRRGGDGAVGVESLRQSYGICGWAGAHGRRYD